MTGYEGFRREYHASAAKAWAMVAGYTIISAALVLRLVSQGAPTVVTVPVALLFVWLLVFLGVALRKGGTIVHEDGLTIRGLGSPRSVPWPEVQGIEIKLNPGGGTRGTPREWVIVYVSTGKRYLLPQLNDRNGYVLEYEVSNMRELWTRRRGDDWAPLPAVAAAIDYHRRHKLTAGTVALLTAICGELAGLVIAMVLLIAGAYANPDELPSRIFTPLVLFGVLPVGTFVVTWLVVGLRRRRERRR